MKVRRCLRCCELRPGAEFAITQGVARNRTCLACRDRTQGRPGAKPKNALPMIVLRSPETMWLTRPISGRAYWRDTGSPDDTDPDTGHRDAI